MDGLGNMKCFNLLSSNLETDYVVVNGFSILIAKELLWIHHYLLNKVNYSVLNVLYAINLFLSDIFVVFNYGRPQ